MFYNANHVINKVYAPMALCPFKLLKVSFLNFFCLLLFFYNGWAMLGPLLAIDNRLEIHYIICNSNHLCTS